VVRACVQHIFENLKGLGILSIFQQTFPLLVKSHGLLEISAVCDGSQNKNEAQGSEGNS
jgi:hypothetical protein